MRKSDGTLHFFINGINVGKKINGVPAVLYGIVDVFGRAEGVTITGMSEYAMFSLTAFNTACSPLFRTPVPITPHNVASHPNPVQQTEL